MRIALIIVLLALVFILLWPTGDVNFDGRLNSADVHQIFTGRLNWLQRIVADVNHDFVVDQFDTEILFEMVLKGR